MPCPLPLPLPRPHLPALDRPLDPPHPRLDLPLPPRGFGAFSGGASTLHPRGFRAFSGGAPSPRGQLEARPIFNKRSRISSSPARVLWCIPRVLRGGRRTVVVPARRAVTEGPGAWGTVLPGRARVGKEGAGKEAWDDAGAGRGTAGCRVCMGVQYVPVNSNPVGTSPA